MSEGRPTVPRALATEAERLAFIAGAQSMGMALERSFPKTPIRAQGLPILEMMALLQGYLELPEDGVRACYDMFSTFEEAEKHMKDRVSSVLARHYGH